MSQTDRKLLELAAKASGVNGFLVDAGLNIGSNAFPKVWNPLTDDGDALRLAAALRITVGDDGQSVRPMAFADQRHRLETRVYELSGDDVERAYRRAIVRAAAEIGKAMQ